MQTGSIWRFYCALGSTYHFYGQSAFCPLGGLKSKITLDHRGDKMHVLDLRPSWGQNTHWQEKCYDTGDVYQIKIFDLIIDPSAFTSLHFLVCILDLL